jgi:hypothetical protein
MDERRRNFILVALWVAFAALVLTAIVAITSGGEDVATTPAPTVSTAPQSPTGTTAPPLFPTGAPGAIPGLVDKNCSDFSTPQEAQNFFREAGGPRKDLHGLDPDHNGVACDDSSSSIGASSAPVSPGASPLGTASATAVPKSKAPKSP